MMVIAVLALVGWLVSSIGEHKQEAEMQRMRLQAEREEKEREQAREAAVERVTFSVTRERPRSGRHDYEDYYVFTWKIKNITSGYLKITVVETDSTPDIGKARSYTVTAGLGPGETAEHSRQIGTGGQYCRLTGTPPGVQEDAVAHWRITSQSGGRDSEYTVYLKAATPVTKEDALRATFAVDEGDSFYTSEDARKQDQAFREALGKAARDPSAGR